MKKRNLIIFSLLLFLVILFIILFFFTNLFRKSVIPKTVNVFGAPRSQTTQNFPTNKPEFAAVIGAIKPASVHQQSIKVYQLGDTKKTTVFDRPFYADGFHGNDLTYTFASGSATVTQSGSLGTIGCSSSDCMLPWSNFYTWDTTQHVFALDNTSHKADFQQLLVTFLEIDKKGCNIVGGAILPEQEAQSFTEIHRKYPSASFYCSKSQGIVPTNLNFFLQAEKALQKIVNGENIGSNDIRDIEM